MGVVRTLKADSVKTPAAQADPAQDTAKRPEDEFIYRVSHDLRTPLAAIKTAIGVVLANEPTGTTEPLSRMFRNIDRAADQMNNMIANLAETIRLREGPQALHCEITDLNDVARRVGRIVEPGLRRQNQKVEVMVPRQHRVALADSPRIERALLNLLENAQKHGPSGGTIRLGLEVNKKEAVFSVADEGPGVPEVVIGRIFGGGLGASSDTGRAGLGLPVAKTIAELHGGRIWLDPSSESGAVFRMALPTVTVRRSPRAKPSKDGNG